MAGWISSKLKVAESFLQQIDQQAADSLGRAERSQSPGLPDEDEEGASKKKIGSVPVKFQLNKKPPERTQPRGGDRRLQAGPSSERNSRVRAIDVPAAAAAAARLSSTTSSTTVVAGGGAAPAAEDGDWTELLGSPKPISPVDRAAAGLSRSPSSVRRSGISAANRKGSSKPRRKSEVASGDENAKGLSSSASADGERGDGEVGRSKFSGGSPDLPDLLVGRPVWESHKDNDVRVSVPSEDINEKSRSAIYDEALASRVVGEDVSRLQDGDVADVGIADFKAGGDGGGINGAEEMHHSSTIVRSSSPRILSRSSSGSNEISDSETDSASTSDSEYERERKTERRRRREQILAEKAAARAAEAIRERENLVARLEGEKQSLEKILDERQKQQVQEASELQMSMMEAMDAVDLEKQKHNDTRMEALACLAKLETTNAELARSLANTQWNLEVEMDRVAELRQQIEFKELSQEELRRRMSNFHQNASSLNQMEASKRAEYEQKILEAEHSFICDKVVQLKEKARSLEENIEITRKEMMHPTEVEVELNKRLEQLTDHLIQKQTQVEALSSEKATLLFRIETVSRLVDENGLLLSAISAGISSAEPSIRTDIESGMESSSYSRVKPLIRDKMRSGEQHLGSFLRQLDAIFAAGVVLLRKSPMVQLWAIVYLLCLHLWVVYILLSHSHASDGVSSSGAVFSLESMNKTSGSS